MVKLKTIKNLYIDQAQYLVRGENGQEVKIKIDYVNSRFDIEGKPKKEFLSDLQIFARDLIERKSRVNFA